MKKLHSVIAIALFFIGCTTIEEFESSIESTNDKSPTTRSGVLITENPYSLANVQTALEQISSQSIVLEPTHTYGKVRPADTLQLNTLQIDLNLELYLYPIDRLLTDAEIESYVNGEPEDGGFPYMYVAVPVDIEIPDTIQYEVLDQLYMQPEGGEYLTQSSEEENASNTQNSATNSFQLSDDLWEAAISQAFLNAGFEEEIPTRAGVWYPSAEIMMTDDRTGTVIPLKGVKIRVNTLTNSGTAYTDKYGRVSGIRGWGGRFRNVVRYAIHFENPKWKVRDGRRGVYEYTGPQMKSHWDHRITGPSKTSFFANVHRAIYEFWYEQHAPAADITKPRSSNLDHFNTAVMYDDSHSKRQARFSPFWRDFGGNPILIYGKSHSTGARISDTRVLECMFHELGHSTHWQAVINKDGVGRIADYWNKKNDKVCESFANGVEYAYMESLYPGYTGSYNSSGDYTGIVEWLMRNGFTLKQIETALLGSTWNGWRDKLKLLGVADNEIVDMLFANPYYRWTWDFNSDFLQGPEQTYINTSVSFSLPWGLLDNGFSIISWTVSPASNWTQTEISDDRSRITGRFASLGENNVTLEYTLPGGTTRRTVTKTIQVTTSAYVGIPNELRIGYYYTIPIQNTTLAGVLSYSKKLTNGQWGYCGLNQDYIPENYSSGNAPHQRSWWLIMIKPGQYRVKAQRYVSGWQAITEYKEFTVVPESNGAKFTSVACLQNSSHKYYILNDDLPTGPGGGLPPGVSFSSSRNEFMVFDKKPTSSHPHYNKLKPLYDNVYKTNFRALDTYIHTQWNSSSKQPLCYIFSSQVPGSFPLYRIVESKYVNESMVYEYIYMTKDNLPSKRNVTSWVWNWLGTKKKRDKNWTETKNTGIAGYVYPFTYEHN